MDDPQPFVKQLEEKLDAKRELLDRTELPTLKETFKLFQSAFKGIAQLLIKKGILHEDPYNFDLKISDVTTPPETAFIEGDKVDQMSIRISQFDSYLDFLNNYYQFSCDFLTMGRIKRLLGLVRYFNFSQFSETSTQMNTRALAELSGSVKKGTDQLSAGLIGDAVAQLDKATRDILAAIKELTAYHRERYKLELRQMVMPGMGLDPATVLMQREDTLRQFKKRLAEVAGDKTYYPELIEEILVEDFGSDGPNLRAEVLKKLEVREEKKVERNQERSFKTTIIEGIRVIAGAGYPLSDAIAKLSDNSALVESRSQGFGAKLAKMIRKILNPEEKKLCYPVSYADPVTNQKRVEELDFAAFADEAGKQGRALASALQRGSTTMRRVEQMNDEQAYKFLERGVADLQRCLRTVTALDDYFREETKPDEKSRMKSVKMEITTIKGAVIKANQKKHEYVAQKEELEQMRRLGIRDANI